MTVSFCNFALPGEGRFRIANHATVVKLVCGCPGVAKVPRLLCHQASISC